MASAGVVAATLALVLSGCTTGSADSTVSSGGEAGPGVGSAAAEERADEDRAADPGSFSGQGLRSRGHDQGRMHGQARNRGENQGQKQGDGSRMGQRATELAVTALEAGMVALDSVPAGKVVAVELEHRRGTALWEVELVVDGSKQEVYVDVNSGQVVGEKTGRSKVDSKVSARLADAKLDFKKAVAAVESAVPGGTIIELELESDSGSVVWEAEVIFPDYTKQEVVVDAVTGKVKTS